MAFSVAANSISSLVAPGSSIPIEYFLSSCERKVSGHMTDFSTSLMFEPYS